MRGSAGEVNGAGTRGRAWTLRGWGVTFNRVILWPANLDPNNLSTEAAGGGATPWTRPPCRGLEGAWLCPRARADKLATHRKPPIITAVSRGRAKNADACVFACSSSFASIILVLLKNFFLVELIF